MAEHRLGKTETPVQLRVAAPSPARRPVVGHPSDTRDYEGSIPSVRTISTGRLAVRLGWIPNPTGGVRFPGPVPSCGDRRLVARTRDCDSRNGGSIPLDRPIYGSEAEQALHLAFNEGTVGSSPT